MRNGTGSAVTGTRTLRTLTYISVKAMCKLLNEPFTFHTVICSSYRAIESVHFKMNVLNVLSNCATA